MTTMLFTLAPADHPTDPMELEGGYKLWSTFRKGRNTIEVRTNNEQTAGGQLWERIAVRGKKGWQISAGKGYLAQASKLLARYLIQKGSKVRCETEAYQGTVKRYKATGKVYSLPTLLNGGKAVVSRDKLADQRAAQRKRSLADLIAERQARKDT